MVIHTRLPELSGMEVYIDVVQGRNLVAKDRNMLGKRTTSDPYVKVLAGTQVLGKTRVVLKNLDPVWNERFHLHLGADEANAVLASSSERRVVLACLIFDSDRFSADDGMGEVQVPVDPLHDSEPKAKWYRVEKGDKNQAAYCARATGELQLKVWCEGHPLTDVQRGESKVLPFHRIRVGLAWDVISPPQAGLTKPEGVDLDCSCVAVSSDGSILMDETVYYGNLSNSNNSIYHSGDETTGEASGDDEKIFLDLDCVPPHVQALYFVLTVATPNCTFAQVQSARVRLIATESRDGICRYVPHKMFGDCTALFLVRLSRNSEVTKQWSLAPIEEGDRHARDFGTLIPRIKSYTRDLVPSLQVDPEERVAVMRKGGTIRVADYTRGYGIPENVMFGLAWDVTRGVEIDLDASAVMMTEELEVLDIVFYKQLSSRDGAVRHSGDEREGDESGDDELISVNVEKVSERVKYIVFVITSYSGQELDDVDKAKCHLFNPCTREDIATYTLSNTKDVDGHTALVMGCLFQENREWFFNVISRPTQGKIPHRVVPSIKKFLLQKPPQSSVEVWEPQLVLDAAMPPAVLVDDDDIVVVPQNEFQKYVQR